MNRLFRRNDTPSAILFNMLLVAFSLFLNGFGVYLTIHADIGAGPWDVFNLGLSNTFSILYGTASIGVSIGVLVIDILLKEPIGVAMIIDAFVVGKTVDLFQWLDWISTPSTFIGSVVMILFGLTVMGFTQVLYMGAALGCGPRDTLLVGLKRRSSRIPIGVISILLLSGVTLIGYLLGGKVGPGTLLCAFLCGPIMQLALAVLRFDATAVVHQHIPGTLKVFFAKKR